MDFAWPTEPAPLALFAFAAVLASWPRASRWILAEISARAFDLGCASASALFSHAYVALYLRGGPRIIDATTYYLEARALADGAFAWPVSEVPASSMGRFLVRDVFASGEHAAGIFPPGYPAVLALGFLVGAPMLVGPLLAALLSLSLVDLARSAARALGLADVEGVARLAGLLGLVCAALRYHTADTMSHGLAALCFTAALAAAYRMREGDLRLAPLVLGLASGWLVATRPPSALALALVLGVAVWPLLRTKRTAMLVPFALAALASLPGLALLAWHQRAATGAWWQSSQSLYYALADGPEGCFRYGFGEGIGCRIEHGDFVAHNLPDGYGAWPAVKTSARRLDKHLFDALDAKWLGPLAYLSIAWALRRAPLRPLALALPALVLAYAPFYFDGNYPGGGARFYADGLAVELVLVALAFVSLAPALAARGRTPAPIRRLLALGTLPVALACAGFAFSGQVEHARLRDREGGRPMFLARDLEAAGVLGGLVFVDTDHGFGLGFDPRARASASTLEVARFRGDAHDRLLWEARGRPPAFRHVFDVALGTVELSPYAPEPATKLEAEALWPPIAQSGLYAAPAWPSRGCLSGRRALVLHPSGEAPSDAKPRSLRLALPSAVGGLAVAPRVLVEASVLELHVEVDRERRASWSVAPGEGCRLLEARSLPRAERVELVLVMGERSPGAGEAGLVDALDALELRAPD